MVSWKIFSPMVLVILGSVVTKPSEAADHLPTPLKANCSSDQFQCANGGCIQKDEVCNCYKDCVDGSDEKDCNDVWSVEPYHRGSYAYYIPGGGCLQHSEICEPIGYKKGFVETMYDDRLYDRKCSAFAPCSNLQFQCSNRKCIQRFQQCDGGDHCWDGSDEVNCAGKCSAFECNNGNCVSYSKKCNCEDDCGDGSDENNCSGKTSQCSDGTCIPNSDLCNCKKDCDDGTDEENCDGLTFHCPDGSCLLSSRVCDCKNDCADGADEENCENDCYRGDPDYSLFVCPNNGTYISSRHGNRTYFSSLLNIKYLNDGFDDCSNGGDENYCSGVSLTFFNNCQLLNNVSRFIQCFENTAVCENKYGCVNRTDGEKCVGKCTEFQCPGGGPCIHNNKVCDCNDDCGDGADEKNCTGLYEKRRKYYSMGYKELDSARTFNYHCRNGECFGHLSSPEFIPCHGMANCHDYSDEMECSGKCQEFECPTGRCIADRYLCDGINDCGDWTDEKNCPDNRCAANQFQCRSGQCLGKYWHCGSDFWASCRDGSEVEKCDWRPDLHCGRQYSNSGCNPFGKYPCCSDQGWCGNTWYHCSCPDCVDYRVCTNGTTYLTNNGNSNCTCVNGKYECKEWCIKGSAKLLEDGCNYCICSDGEYKYCTERTCKPEDLPNSDELSTNGTTHSADEDTPQQDEQDVDQ